MESGRLRQYLINAVAAVLRAYFRHVPFRFGKRAVWTRIVHRLIHCGAELEAHTLFGARMKVSFPDTIQSYVYFFGVWEPAITAYLASVLRPGDTMIDIGANVGYDSLLAAHCVGPTGQVFAIEASPTVFRKLQENLALNDTACVIACHAAVCATTGDVPVFLHNDSNLGGTIIVPAVARRRGARLEATVPGRPLSDLVPKDAILSARIIKIDVEGAEWPVVCGIAALLPHLSQRTELLIEISTEVLHDHGSTAAAFLDLFHRSGFRPFVIPNVYSVDMYLDPAQRVELEPLVGDRFEQLDILFRRA